VRTEPRGTALSPTDRTIDQQPQQTGMLLINRQHTQPDLCIADMQAQQASIIAQQAGSPLVQVTQTPSSVGSHLLRPIVKLKQQTNMPLSMQQQLHRPPAIMVQRFCSMPAETLSSHTQAIFIPPLHLENFMVQRGTIIVFIPATEEAGAPIIPLGFDTGMPGMPMPDRSIMIADVILVSFAFMLSSAEEPAPSRA
jgi:hypothetical protein